MTYHAHTRKVAHDDLVWDFGTPTYQVFPYEHYRWCRENDPVHRVNLPNGNVVYMITKYDDIKAAALDHKRFSAAVTDTVGWLMFKDPPEHTTIRSSVQSHLSKKGIDLIDEAIDRINRETFQYLLDGRGGDAATYCQLFPAAVVNHMLGIKIDPQQIDYWIGCSLRAMGQAFGLPGKPEDHKGQADLVTFLEGVVRDYIAHPEDNIGSLLAQNAAPGGKLSVRNVADFMNMLFTGGHETTTFTLSSAIGILGQDPALFRRLKDDRSRIPAFIDETLRYRPVLQSNPRIAAEDITIRGVTIPKGSIVKLCTGSGNMDEDVFENPEEFNIDRPNVSEHLSFSRGVHTCIGAVLARRELSKAMTHLFETVASIRLDADRPVKPHLGGTGNEHGFDSVPVVIEADAVRA
ncbi:cytochrome P450 [Variovorax sp. E3]|uniref:cytochrome P450 n=1 Tax=Variovorax sp. E3 TaxID=1914993 RepID=UPI0018DD2031|nr:cytochrome P450 [Variovorax sp. E3]